MLQRQRVLLQLIGDRSHGLSRVVLVKLAFLLREEAEVAQSAAFYDFVPYRYGPFSFALYRELAALQRDGYVVSNGNHVRWSDRLASQTRAQVAMLNGPLRNSVQLVVDTYKRMPQSALLRTVYQRFPWYAVASRCQHLVPAGARKRNSAPIAVYTIGYEGKTVDGFFNCLMLHGVRAILDVRANPVSRKYGFARSSMSDIALKLDLGYQHLPELGIDSRARAGLSDFESYQRLMDWYQRDALPKRADAIMRLVSLLRDRPSALLCVEKDIRCCHRSRLAEAASEISGLPIVHL